MFRKVVALVILPIVAVLAGCSLLSHEAPSEDVDKAAALFFDRLGNADYTTIYNDCAKGFKDSQPKPIVTENLRQMAEHGKILDFQRISMTFQGEGKSRMALPVYRTSSEQAKAEITLTFQDEGGEWKLFGFSYKPRV